MYKYIVYIIHTYKYNGKMCNYNNNNNTITMY